MRAEWRWPAAAFHQSSVSRCQAPVTFKTFRPLNGASVFTATLGGCRLPGLQVELHASAKKPCVCPQTWSLATKSAGIANFSAGT